MKSGAHIRTAHFWSRSAGIASIVALALGFTQAAFCAEHPGGAPHGEGGFARPAPAPHPAAVDRFNHGTIRHAETHVVPRPEEVHREAPREIRPEEHREAPREIEHRPEVFEHHDVDVDIHRHHFWNDFVFGRRFAVLPPGYATVYIGGAPYYYADGIYYQPSAGGYQEVYPPAGAEVSQPPDGSIPIQVGDLVYYFAGGAFYAQQPDGMFAVVAPPIGAIVPDLPPGAVQTVINGTVVYQFNNVYYRPVFVNGVTQYQIFQP